MKRKRLLFGILFVFVVLVTLRWGEDGGQKAQKKSVSPKQTQTTPQAPKAPQPASSQPQTAPEKAKFWPYLTQEHQVAIADDLLARNIVLIFDGSGSMGDIQCSGSLTKCQAAQNAVMDWSTSIAEGANLGLAAFHANSQGLTTLELAVGNRERFIGTIKAIRPGGKTPLTNSFYQAFLMLEKQAQKQLGYGEYTIVVVTDGFANDSKSLTRMVNYLLKHTPINIYTIGFCISGEHSLNQAGRTYYRAANNPQQLRQGLKEALAESEEFDVTDFN